MRVGEVCLDVAMSDPGEPRARPSTRRRLAVALAYATAGFLLGVATYLPRPGWNEPVASSTPSLAERTDGSTLWLVAVGVSRHQESGLDLRYAADDARAIGAALAEQAPGRLYQRVVPRVLVDSEGTRDEILDALREVLRSVQPQDVLTVFFAGHGMIDPAAGGYYFLTYDATKETLAANALRSSDLDRVIRQARRRTRAVVLLFDTCYAGAVPVGGTLRPTSELVGSLSTGEGMFLLAAARPGEESQEHSTLTHGVFTHALLTGLAGGADSNGDDVVSVSEIFGHVARQVTALTAGQQNPYYKIEGTDLRFASVRGAGQQFANGAVGGRTQGEDRFGHRVAVLTFLNLGQDNSYNWVGEALRMAFTTELTKVAALDVYAPELIDATARTRATDALTAATYLGIDRLITGSFAIVGDRIRLDARIIAVAPGTQQGSDSVEGALAEFFDLQKGLVLRLLKRLPVAVGSQEGELIQKPSNTDIDAYRLLLQSEDVVDDLGPRPLPSTPPADSRQGATPTPDMLSCLWRYFAFPAAYAEEPRPTAVPDTRKAEAEVRLVLEAYRRALERGDLEAVDDLYAEPSSRRKELQRQYLANAMELKLELVDVVIEAHPEGLLVAFTRRDSFTDRGTGRAQHLEVRLTRLFRLKDGTWKISGKP